jgi:hypothetical protein
VDVVRRSTVPDQLHIKQPSTYEKPEAASSVLGSKISRQSAHEGGRVVSPTHQPPLPPENIPGTHFC